MTWVLLGSAWELLEATWVLLGAAWELHDVTLELPVNT